MSNSEPKARVHFRSLGCPKNQLDSEIMLGHLASHGYAIAEELDAADVVVINTCSFIESAREESIEAILDVAQRKESGALRGLIVSGCLPQRYGAELARELPEVDAFVGTGYITQIASILDAALAGKKRGVYVDAGRSHLYSENEPRMLIGPRHSAYIKIAEGCNRACTFCAIPSIRGRFQSRSLESIVAEAQQLATFGTQEINLVSQDSTYWGKDRSEASDTQKCLSDLLRALDEIAGLRWIRLLYTYPTSIRDDLIEVLASGTRLLPYVDVPLQHASDGVLQAMRRGATETEQRRLIEKLRTKIPNLTLRTTFIVGFPGESDADFETLCDFVREMRFDRAGVFQYSDEEGTAAFELGPKVPRKVARARQRELMRIQQEIMHEQLGQQVGDEVEILVDESGRRPVGRLWSQAPEIDGQVFLRGSAVRAGQFVRAKITGVRNRVDLEAEVLDHA